MKRLKVLALMHPDLVPPPDAAPADETSTDPRPWKTEYDVLTTLEAMGHTVRPLGVQEEVAPIRREVAAWEPDVVFNLMEEFHGDPSLDHHVAAYLELLQVPYTGCNPRGLVLTRSKALVKKLMVYHRIATPDFAVFPIGRAVRRPARLDFPLIVKSTTEHASWGISQASVVDDDDKLAERVAFIHQRIGTDAMASRYIHGRELYVGVLGNIRRTVLPVWELTFENLADGARPIATEAVKHDPAYQERRGILQGPAEDLPDGFERRMARMARRICRILEVDGYARLDFRMDDDDRLHLLEVNPNCEIARSEEFATAAAHAGIPYEKLLQRMLNLALRRAGR